MEVGPFAFMVRPRPGIGMDRPYSSRDSLSDRARYSLRVQTKEAGRDTNCARSLPSEHFSSSCSLAVGSRDIKRHPRRCEGMRGSLLHPCDITQRTTKLKLRGSDNCRHYTNHGSHTEPPTTACTASERVEWSRSLPPSPLLAPSFKRRGKEVGNRRKRARTDEPEVGWGQGSGKSSRRCRSTSAPPYQILPL